MLRPLLCRGPIDVEGEYMLLLGALEKGWRLPAGALRQAESNRVLIIHFPSRRVKHERIPE